MPEKPERVGPGRRKEDEECREHSERMSDIEVMLSRYTGWLKGTAIGVSVIAFAATVICSIVISKLNGIETLLSDGKTEIAVLKTTVTDLTRRVTIIEDRHRQDAEDGSKRNSK